MPALVLRLQTNKGVRRLTIDEPQRQTIHDLKLIVCLSLLSCIKDDTLVGRQSCPRIFQILSHTSIDVCDDI